jgi:hypothetical protein
VAEKFELQSKVAAMDNIHNMSVQELPAAVSLTRDESLLLWFPELGAPDIISLRSLRFGWEEQGQI